MGVASKKGRTYLYIAAVAALLIFVGTVQQQSNDHYPELKEAILENLKSFGRVSQDADLETSSINLLSHGDDDEDEDEALDFDVIDNEYVEFSKGSVKGHDASYSSDPDDHPLRKPPSSFGGRSGKDVSSSSPSSHEYSVSRGDSLYAGEAIDARNQPSFYEIAIEKGTDKVTMHTYHDMYERYLPALRNRRIKLLEIGGVDCSMANGPGPSYYTWLEYFPYAELYFIETDAACVEKWRERLRGAKMVMVGNQADEAFLESFYSSLVMNDPEFAFDVIIDDGGHMMDQQLVSLQTLWKAVKPGGTYFVEDLETSYLEEYGGGRAAAGAGGLRRKDTMVQFIQKMAEDLMYPDARMEVYHVEEGQDKAWYRKVQFDEVESINHIDCSRQICAISKRKD